MIKSVIANDIQMDYATFNEGERAFVIIPGLSLRSVMLSADVVENRYKEMAKDYSVYLMDYRKYAPLNYTIDKMADDIYTIMRKIGIKSAYIFAVSEGAMIAQCIAIKYPEIVVKLVLGSTLAKTTPRLEKVIGNWILLARQKRTDELVEDMLKNIYSKATFDKYREILLASYENITDYELSQFINVAEGARDFSVIKQLHKINCPVLVLGSMGDKVTTPEGCIQIAEALNCEIYMYDDTYGHGVYDEAEDYISRIFAFLNAKE